MIRLSLWVVAIVVGNRRSLGSLTGEFNTPSWKPNNLTPLTLLLFSATSVDGNAKLDPGLQTPTQGGHDHERPIGRCRAARARRGTDSVTRDRLG